MSDQLSWTCPNCGDEFRVPADHAEIRCVCGYSTSGTFVPSLSIARANIPEWELQQRQAACFSCKHYHQLRCGSPRLPLEDIDCKRAYAGMLRAAAPKCPEGEWTMPKVRFVQTSELAEAANRLADMLPSDVGRVVGIPRSGMIPAATIATRLHVPLWTLCDCGIRPVGGGSRTNWGTFEIAGRSILVDDTLHSGGTIAKYRAEVPEIDGMPLAVAFAQDAALAQWCAETLPSPHFLEWNLFNSGYVQSIAFDLDGVICQNPPHQARPRYLTRSSPPKAIITARPEAERQTTEAWLAQWGVRYDRLVMWPGTKDSRFDLDKVAGWKATEFFRTGAEFYVESEPPIADAMRKHNVRVLCPDQGGLW